jgi:hypothetical protein
VGPLGRGLAVRDAALSHSIQQLIVSLVGTDPEPVVVIPSATGHGAVGAAYLGGPKFSFGGETQRRMPGILEEQLELLVGQPMDRIRKRFITLPERR